MKKKRITFSKWSENEDGQIGKAIRVNGRYVGFIRYSVSAYHVYMNKPGRYEYFGMRRSERDANDLARIAIREEL